MTRSIILRGLETVPVELTWSEGARRNAEWAAARQRAWNRACALGSNPLARDWLAVWSPLYLEERDALRLSRGEATP